ncbi:hypothetical protein AN639_12110 [Candidatus Epulonipiscium fishelsonii]|uniref:Uncharacterized protein n=1 Tax=Candidatus Epulonipiscium fishelsonii TaxID=77094 RepID=A0ACC8X7J9_9FIRM|nr:hypothetical protein AN396_12550 [Epulopiscium sp. SCG-B11WGA-EpuloA1]ONI42671.1 hypothetical protein AN639_12110 [Epulopiscium sp. SCG-B05WGA-EpuloA1]
MKEELQLKNLLELPSTLKDFIFPTIENATEILKKEHNLKEIHFKTLMLIKFHPNSTMSQISKKLQLEKGGFTPVVYRLLSNNFVKKDAGEDDKRKFYLNLTEKGIALTEQIKMQHINCLENKLKNLSDSEQQLFHSIVEVLLALCKKAEY